MEILIYKKHTYASLDKGLNAHSENDDVNTNVQRPQPHATAGEETKVSLSSQALTMLHIDKTQSNKTYEQEKR